MPLFKITVKQIVEHLEDPNDRNENPAGEYTWYAKNSDIALDEFHATVPIGCLDDFDIYIEQEK